MSDSQLNIAIRHTLHTAQGILPMEVSFSLEKAAIMALTGHSGAGKTTLLKQIAGLLMPEEGNIKTENSAWLDTQNQISLPPQQRNIGFVFQDYALFPNMTVAENLTFALPKGGDRTIIKELLEATGLENLSGRKPDQLSGGQQQRVALARALVRKPELLLLDEPFSAVDPDMRYQLQELILKFHKLFQFTAIIVTHETSEIFRLADQVGIMENGKLPQFGPPAQVYLNINQPEKDLYIHGEIINYTKTADCIFANALIDNKIRLVKLPLGMEENILAGKKFTLSLSLRSPEILWLS
ncbi:Fe(3+) ions import ATP-binding protein FbpC 2 [Dyadobacter sp. CECT 9623]|uniref:Fe(3+) ions import ATP-binding protein FbpC 2 n=1 Tax=Dyadobacter linearis TaxID=2823330 RepID=A0ABM8US39_9BACT|nr:ABC transporter ATP-binding protein [Dyadobacter sp. CECT 9623]CAG5070551.1 Fe(3+) ions import ATP-binding protein FbpC 2 [Dyadobacter sp. CECT 9623]